MTRSAGSLMSPSRSVDTTKDFARTSWVLDAPSLQQRQCWVVHTVDSNPREAPSTQCGTLIRHLRYGWEGRDPRREGTSWKTFAIRSLPRSGSDREIYVVQNVSELPYNCPLNIPPVCDTTHHRGRKNPPDGVTAAYKCSHAKSRPS